VSFEYALGRRSAFIAVLDASVGQIRWLCEGLVGFAFFVQRNRHED
jgi:hypothetical protein